MNNDLGDILDVWPLTPLQEGLFALNKLSLGKDPYHIQLMFKIEGYIDEELFIKALNDAIDRYPNLRSAFYDEDLESPIQIISKDSYPIINKIKLTIDIENKQILEIAREEFSKPFDLSYGCPIRILFVNLKDNLNYFILTAHHIIIDGWSLPLFFKEIMRLYLLNNKKELLPNPVDYKSYIIWLKNKDIQTGLKIWNDYLSDFSNPTLLSNNKTQISNTLIRYKDKLSKEDTQNLVILCKKLRLTLNSVFLFAWSVILGHLTDSSDVVFGVTVSGRPYDLKDVDKMIGLFINTIACRVKLDPALPLGTQCCKFQEELFRIRDYEYIGLGTIQRSLNVNNNLFDTLLIFQNTPVESNDVFELLDAKIYPISLVDSTHYPLTLVAALVNEQFSIEAEVKSDLADIIDGEYIVDNVLLLLKNFSKYENTPLSQIPIVNKNSNTNDLVLENKLFNKIDYPKGVWGIFKEQFDKDNEAISLIIPDIINNNSKIFTIGDLFYLSEKISLLILSKLSINAKNPIRVGILLPRNEFIISSFFACIKLGLIIVPLDISSPIQNIEKISQKSNLKLIITNKFKNINGIDILNLSEYDFDNLKFSQQNINDKFISLNQEIYTIFTSGSTGESKGVTATYGNIIILMNSHKKLFLDKLSVNRVLKVGHAWSFSFDASWQPLVYFLLGHTLVLLDEVVQKDPDLFIKCIHKYKIDFIETSPTLLKNVDLNLLFDKSYHQLRILGLGGEAIDNSLWSKLSKISNLKVINFYGPTETCVDALCANFDDSNYPILGKPIAGIKAFVFDGWLRSCKNETVGELYLIGDQLTYGYLNDTRSTSIKFVAYDNGQRMYRTGDLASLTKEGFFKYHGRIDDQLKINGFRIDPNELAKALINNIQVDDARVFVLNTQNGKKISAAIILKYKNFNHREVIESIYNYLRVSLANHLIPYSITIVDKFPLNTNGKLDVNSLPNPVIISSTKAQTKTEICLSNIIKNILSLDKDSSLDVKVDFRSLGLDSILIIQFSNLLKREGFNNVNPRVILRNNNIFELASYLDNISFKDNDTLLVENDSDFNCFKLTPIMAWLVRFKNWQRFCQWSVISIPDNYDYHQLLNNIKQLINIHSILRLKIDKSNKFRGIIQNPNKVLSQYILKVLNKDLYEYDKLELKKEIINTIDEINPENGIILRILWFPKKNNKGGNIILLIHHLATDGVSWRIIFEDLKNFDKNNLVKEITPFAKWAFILDKNKKIIESSDYFYKWQDYLNIEQFSLGSRYIDKNKDLACNAYSKTIITSSEITQLILKLSQQGFELEHILLAIFTDTIDKWYKLKYADKKIKHILIDKESHGRDDNTLNSFGEESDDLSRTLGWFTVISPLKLEINSFDNIIDKLNSIRKSIINIPSKELDFTLLYEKISFSGAQIEFNFNGILDNFSNKDDSDWTMLIDNTILDILPEVSEPLLNRVYSLEVNSVILSTAYDKRLTTKFNMSKDVFSEDDFVLMQKIWTDTINKYYKELLTLIG